MTLVNFPSYAIILFANYLVTRPTALQRTAMDSGPAKQAKRLSRVMVARAVNLQFTALADYQNFITWYRTSINYGADWFNWTDPVDGVVKTARIAGQIDKETPVKADGSAWLLQCTIETWDS